MQVPKWVRIRCPEHTKAPTANSMSILHNLLFCTKARLANVDSDIISFNLGGIHACILIYEHFTLKVIHRMVNVLMKAPEILCESIIFHISVRY